MFLNFSDILPDPDNKINEAGASDSEGSEGPGFASVKFKSTNETQVSRTKSGRGVTASPSYHTWSFDINYNPMTREEFDPVASFLEARDGRFKPFYVILPQHNYPKDTTFADNYVTCSYLTEAGSPNIMIDGVVYGEPSVGDFFNIVDYNDSNHKKTYKVTRVESPGRYQVGTTPPGTNQRRIWTKPAMTREVSAGAQLVFVNPKFRVIQTSDVFEYDLDTESLYKFSLSLEELLP